jgi:RecA-family ATPase
MPEADMVMAPCFTRAQLVTLTAHPGAGKSTVCGSAAIHHALIRALGPLTPESDGCVYYVSREDQAGTALRLQAEAARLQLTEQDRAMVNARLRWVLVNENMAPEIIAESMREDAAGMRIDLVFVDTGVALFCGDDENANAQLQAFAARCRWFVNLPGSPCTVVMHCSPTYVETGGASPRRPKRSDSLQRYYDTKDQNSIGDAVSKRG